MKVYYEVMMLGVGYMVNMEKPQEFNRIVLKKSSTMRTLRPASSGQKEEAVIPHYDVIIIGLVYQSDRHPILTLSCSSLQRSQYDSVYGKRDGNLLSNDRQRAERGAASLRLATSCAAKPRVFKRGRSGMPNNLPLADSFPLESGAPGVIRP